MSHYKPYPAYKDSGVEWLGTVPEHWKVTPLGYEIGLLTGYAFPSEKFDFDDGIPLVRGDNVTEGSLRWGDKARFWPNVTSELERYLLKERDVLIGMDGSKVGKNYAMVASSDLPLLLVQRVARLRANGSVSSNFIFRLIGSPLFKTWVDLVRTDPAIPHISPKDINSFPIAVPPPAEQDTILGHLDSEVARIDALVEKKTRFIELLREKRQALITHAVTKGLASKVKMKYSGVEWLGEVPEHWEVKQLKHVVDPNSSITYGIVQAGPEYEGGVPYIRTSDMSGDALPISGYPLTSPEIDGSYARSRVRPGDIVMSIRASVGKCLPVPDGLSVANLTQGTAKVSPGKDITRDFLLTYLNSGAAQVYFDLMAKGATFKEITLDALRRTPVLLPPRDEQAEIDQFIAQHIGRLDQLWQLSERSIGMLKERRSALITAAVTGQIDLRETV